MQKSCRVKKLFLGVVILTSLIACESSSWVALQEVEGKEVYMHQSPTAQTNILLFCQKDIYTGALFCCFCSMTEDTIEHKEIVRPHLYQKIYNDLKKEYELQKDHEQARLTLKVDGE